MGQTGLTDRLNQHSQRSGPVLGCAMALVLLVCVGTGIVLYQRLDEYRVDVFGIPTVVQSVPTLAPAGTPGPIRAVNRGATVVAARETPREGGTASKEEATPTPVAATRYRIARTDGENLNMRAEPTTQSRILVRLPPGSIVEDAGEQANGSAGAQQVVWRKIKGPGGQVGWVPAQFLDTIEG